MDRNTFSEIMNEKELQDQRRHEELTAAIRDLTVAFREQRYSMPTMLAFGPSPICVNPLFGPSPTCVNPFGIGDK